MRKHKKSFFKFKWKLIILFILIYSIYWYFSLKDNWPLFLYLLFYFYNIDIQFKFIEI